MRYWDSSALVPLFVSEKHSVRVREWLKEDPAIVTWGWTRVEIAAAIERRAREQRVTRQQRRDLFARLNALADSWDEVTDLLAVRTRALPLLARHTLRAADAAQLAAAVTIGHLSAAPITFVCLDENLAAAAEREGLPVLSP